MLSVFSYGTSQRRTPSPTSNGRLLKFKELIAHESHDQTGLADGRVAQEHKLEMARSALRHVGVDGVDASTGGGARAMEAGEGRESEAPKGRLLWNPAGSRRG